MNGYNFSLNFVFIIVAILVVVLISSITNYQKETKFHELNDSKMKELNIIKNEKLREIYKRRYLGRRFNYGDIMATDLL